MYAWSTMVAFKRWIVVAELAYFVIPSRGIVIAELAYFLLLKRSNL